ncbi:MAG TPA: RIP metalloprotease RseP [Vicinamibacteria bacterium]|nr:RIP metalloprotease RseP [Vicinamibacteria bacterium]
MSFLTTPLAFVVVLGIIIFVHEFGHLITAKAFGMRVFIFSFGFGKRLLGFKWGDTDCRLSAVPLGGYVKLEGEPGDRLSEDTATLGDGKDFLSRPRWQRFVVYLAGPVMNAVLTITVLTGFYMVGFQVPGSRFDRPIVGAVDPGSPAERAGLVPGDEILSIDGQNLPSWEEAQYHILLRPNRALSLRVRHAGEERDVAMRSEATSAERVGSIGVHPLVRVGQVLPGQPAEKAGFRSRDAILAIDGKTLREFADILPIVGGSGGKTLTFRVWRDGQVTDVEVTPRDSGQGYKVGLGPYYVTKKFGPSGAVAEAMGWTWDMTRQTFDVIGRLVTARISPRTMMGPLGIAQASGDAARGGAGSLLFLVAVISLQVGILNLFPLAPLDGGHLAILAVEGTARRDMSPVVKGWIMNAGAAAIFLLIGLVLYSDISKIAFVQKLLQ